MPVDNRIMLRVWPGSDNGVDSLFSFGHVALRTYTGGANGEGIYASIWPGRCVEWGADKPNFCKSSVPHNHTADEDDLLMNPQEPTEIVFYGLDAIKINRLFARIERRGWDYNLVASLLPTDNPTQQTCAAFVVQLLVEGGIEQYLSRIPKAKRILGYGLAGVGVVTGQVVVTAVGMRSVIFTPNDLIRLMLRAKEIKDSRAFLPEKYIGLSCVNNKYITVQSKSTNEMIVWIPENNSFRKILLPDGASSIEIVEKENNIFVFTQQQSKLAIYPCDFFINAVCNLKLVSPRIEYQESRRLDSIMRISSCGRYAVVFKKYWNNTTVVCIYLGENFDRWLEYETLKIPAYWARSINSVAIYVEDAGLTRMISIAVTAYTSTIPSLYQFTHNVSRLQENNGFIRPAKYLTKKGIGWRCCINYVSFIYIRSKLLIVTGHDGGNICFWGPNQDSTALEYLGKFSVSHTEIIHQVIFSNDTRVMVICTNCGYYICNRLQFDDVGVLENVTFQLNATAHPAGLHEVKQGCILKSNGAHRVVILKSGKITSYSINVNRISDQIA